VLLLLDDVVSPSVEEVEAPTCVDVESSVLPVVVASDEGVRNTSAAKAPARSMSAIPAIRATVESFPARPADFAAGIFPSPPVGRLGPYLLAPSLDHRELGIRRVENLGL
jgi:hypothetical protein